MEPIAVPAQTETPTPAPPEAPPTAAAALAPAPQVPETAPAAAAQAAPPAAAAVHLVVPEGDDDEDEVPEVTAEEALGLEEIFGGAHELWFPCTEVGKPGDMIRKLGPEAYVLIARMPNDYHTKLCSAVAEKYERQHNSRVPNSKWRKETPDILSKSIFKGMRGWRLKKDGPPIDDSPQNRKAILTRYPELGDSIAHTAKNSDRFGGDGDGLEGALGNS